MRSFHEVGLPMDVLLLQMGSMLHVVDRENQIVFTNELWLVKLGYDASEAEDLNFAKDVVADASLALYWQKWHAVLEAQSPVEFEMYFRHRTGEILTVGIRLVPRIEAGEVVTMVAVSRDVTTVMRSYRQLEQLFTLSTDMLGLSSSDGRFIRLNPAWERTLGYPIAEMLNQPFIDYVHPDDVERTEAESLRLTEGGEPRVFENRYRRADGTYRWLAWNPSPELEHGVMFFVARDITESKYAEETISRAKEQLQAIIDNAGTVIYLKDLDSRYLLVNREYELRFGVSRHAITGKDDAFLFPAHYADIMREHEQKAIDRRTPLQFEESLPEITGLHTYLTTKFPLLDEHGRPYAVCSIGADITYRKITEIQLALRNQAIEYSPSAISIADTTLPDMPLIYINPAFEAVTGYSALEAIGRICRFLQGSDRAQPELAEIRDAIREGRPCSVTIRNYRRDGTLFYNELRLAPIRDDDGRLTHFVGISTDVTDRVRSDEHIQAQNEALLRANHALALARKQAEDATRLKSQFLATMSHELRTPLNAIIGYTEIQLAGMTGELTGEQRDYQERVLANADHLLQLINDVLDIAKIEAGRMELVNKRFDLTMWLDEVVSQTQGLAEEKALLFQATIDERMPRKILGDPARIKQIALNLLSNAIKFTNEGIVRIQIRKHGRDAWKLIVSDSGIGIPSHLQETIFEEFRQVDSTSQRKQGGTGLGLSIVRKFALMMGGNVRVQSKPGVGSVFTVILPLEPAEDMAITQGVESE